MTASLTIVPRGAKPLQLDIPSFVSDVSYDTLSKETKTGHAVKLVITGILRVAKGFTKAMALCAGAGAVAVSKLATQAVGRIAAHMCNSSNFPVGSSTEKLELHKRLDVQFGTQKRERYFGAPIEITQFSSRACGQHCQTDFTHCDITTWKKERTDFSGVRFDGINI